MVKLTVSKKDIKAETIPIEIKNCVPKISTSR
jgi:hypothetical protein